VLTGDPHDCVQPWKQIVFFGSDDAVSNRREQPQTIPRARTRKLNPTAGSSCSSRSNPVSSLSNPPKTQCAARLEPSGAHESSTTAVDPKRRCRARVKTLAGSAVLGTGDWPRELAWLVTPASFHHLPGLDHSLRYSTHALIISTLLTALSIYPPIETPPMFLQLPPLFTFQ